MVDSGNCQSDVPHQWAPSSQTRLVVTDNEMIKITVTGGHFARERPSPLIFQYNSYDFIYDGQAKFIRKCQNFSGAR